MTLPPGRRWGARSTSTHASRSGMERAGPRATSVPLTNKTKRLSAVTRAGAVAGCSASTNDRRSMHVRSQSSRGGVPLAPKPASARARSAQIHCASHARVCRCAVPYARILDLLEDRVAVVTQLVEALAYVVHGSVSAGLLRGVSQFLRVPPASELLDGRHVDGSIVEVLLDLRQLHGEEATIGSDGVPAQRHGAGFRYVLSDEGERLFTSIFQRD